MDVLASSPPRKERTIQIAGWSSQVARQAHNLKVVGSNPTPVTNESLSLIKSKGLSPFWGNRSVNTYCEHNFIGVIAALFFA